MNDLTAFQRDILYVILTQEKLHGLAIKDELDDYYEEEVNRGRLYTNLKALITKRLVEKSQRDRRSNYYTLTQQGHKQLRARRKWESQNRVPRKYRD